MGLDMYLEKEYYFFNDENDCSVEFRLKGGEATIRKKTDTKKADETIKLKNVKKVIQQTMYWRKANAIHKWFVDNVQDGEDNCGKYEVTIEQLKELVDLCKKILENHDLAQELLPTQSGFFFGSTEYDEWYFQDLEDTVKGLENIESEVLKQEGVWETFYYHSSW